MLAIEHHQHGRKCDQRIEYCKQYLQVCFSWHNLELEMGACVIQAVDLSVARKHSPSPAVVCHATFFQREYPEAIKNYRMALDQVSVKPNVFDMHNGERRGGNEVSSILSGHIGWS